MRRSACLAVALPGAALAMLTLGAAALPLHAAQPGSPRQGWAVWAGAEEESVAVGVPVLALDRDDWATYLREAGGAGRALRRIDVYAGALHSSGWGLATVARSQAWLEASADSVALAAMESRHIAPDTPRRFALGARSEGWEGRGLRGTTPWFALDDASRWRWQAGLDWLRLRKLRVRGVEGNIAYEGGDAYDVRLRMYRADRDVTGRFLPPSGDAGTGVSLSLALQGELLPGWRMDLRAQDWASRLRWNKLGTDERVIDSQITTRAEDGTLDYAPVVRGTKAIESVATKIGTRWQALWAWNTGAWSTGASRPGEFQLRIVRSAHLTQRWLGWQDNAGSPTAMHWGVAFKPTLGALRIGLGGGRWHLTLATDGRGLASQYRQIAVGWQWGGGQGSQGE